MLSYVNEPQKIETMSPFDSVLAALYDGVMAPAGFQDFIEKFTSAFALMSATLITHHEANHEAQGLWAHSITMACLGQYAPQYASDDMLAQHMRSAPIGRFYASNLDLPCQTQSPMYCLHRDWQASQGICCAASSIVWREGLWCTELSVQRGLHQALFSRQDLYDLDRLLPHVERAIRMRKRFASLQMRQDLLSASIDLLTAPVFFFDEHRRVTYLNQLAERLLSANSGVAVTNAHLVVCEPVANRSLNAAIGNAILISRGQTAVPINVIRLLRDGRLPLILLVAPLRLRGTPVQSPGALVLGFDPEITPNLHPSAVSMLFDFTDAEACLAAALCSRKTLVEIATQRGVTLHTIKSQLKSLFIKTGTNRQSRLISLLLASPACFLSQTAVSG